MIRAVLSLYFEYSGKISVRSVSSFVIRRSWKGCALASLVRREAYVLSYIYAFWLTAWVSLTEFC